MIARLLRSARGSVAVEFALVAPVFLIMVMGTMEYCRVAWTSQTLNTVAYATARCATYGSTCTTTSAIQSYAVSMAGSHALTVSSGNVSYTSNTTCRGNTGQNMVQITYSFTSPLAGLFPGFPSSITSTGCFTK